MINTRALDRTVTTNDIYQIRMHGARDFYAKPFEGAATCRHRGRRGFVGFEIRGIGPPAQPVLSPFSQADLLLVLRLVKIVSLHALGQPVIDRSARLLALRS